MPVEPDLQIGQGGILQVAFEPTPHAGHKVPVARLAVTDDQAGEYAEELAAEMLATTLDVEFDPDTSWDEKKEIYRISNKIVRTSNVTQSAVGDKRGKWTTTIAAAVLILDE